MNDAVQKLHDAYAQMEPPKGLNERTLAWIEQQRETGSDDEMHVSEPASPASNMRSKGFRIVSRRMAFAIAACLAIALVGVFGARVYFNPTAYIDIDMNPSIELTLNCFDRVIESEGINDDGTRVASSLSLDGLAYEDALQRIMTSPEFNAYVKDDSFIAINVIGEDAQTSTIVSQSEACMQRLNCESTCSAATEEERHAAKTSGMGVGKYRAAVELSELDEAVTIDECSHMSMRELRNRIAQERSGGDVDETYISSATDQESGQGAGHNGSQDAEHDAGQGVGQHHEENTSQQSQTGQQSLQQKQHKQQGHHR